MTPPATDQATDRALMRRIAGRDDAAFADLVARYGSRLHAVARRILGPGGDADDIVQRAFLQVHTAAATYRPEWAVSTWVYRIVSNLCIDELRRRAARAHLGEAVARDAAGGGVTHHPGAGRLDVGRALERVPREARLLLVLRYVDGLSYDELARVRGISVNTVKSQLARGKSILREALGSETAARPRRGGGARRAAAAGLGEATAGGEA